MEENLPCNCLVDYPLRLNFYDQAHLAELVASIKATGLFEPLLVRPVAGGYQVLSGHYRLRAIRQLKWSEAPCRVYPCNEHTAKLLFCTANLTTRTLSALEEAWLLKDLVENEGFSFTRAGALFGRSKSWVCRRLKLLSALDPRVIDAVALGRLKPRLAHELTRLPRGNDQLAALAVIKEQHLSKEEVARLVAGWPLFQEQPALAVARRLWHCTRLMEEVLDILRRQKRPFNWWPAEPYRFFLGALDRLSTLLTEGGEEPAPDYPGAVKQKGL